MSDGGCQCLEKLSKELQLERQRRTQNLLSFSLINDSHQVLEQVCAEIGGRCEKAEAECARLREGAIHQERETQQILGKALGYPRYCDDPQNFPTTTEADGVCVGEHTAMSLVDEAAKKIAELKERVSDYRRYSDEVAKELAPIRQYRETGEPAQSDREEIHRLVTQILASRA